MTEKKAVFFDIDGTIWDIHNEIPESTIRAIKELQKNGHLAFICTGRSRGYVRNPKLLNIGFDGIVSGCGTMIEYKNEVLFCKELDKKLVEDTVNTVRKYGFRPILEGKEYLYMDEADFAGDRYGDKVMTEMGEKLRGVTEEWGKWEISKLSCATVNADIEGCFEALKDHYDYLIHNPYVVEMVPKGFDKGVGIQKVCELLEIPIENTYAIGDSVNDLGMLKAAGTGIAMGNGTEEAKAHADYITTALHEDGIWNACRHFELI